MGIGPDNAVVLAVGSATPPMGRNTYPRADHKQVRHPPETGSAPSEDRPKAATNSISTKLRNRNDAVSKLYSA